MAEQTADIIRRVSDIYEWIDSQVLAAGEQAGMCGVCGRCCDFAAFGHKLFVTSVEMLGFIAGHSDDLKEMHNGICPYNVNGRCGTYATRFGGCRIFCCTGDANLQSTLSEAALAKFKGLCLEYEVPYRYMDLSAALNCAASGTCR